MSLDMSVYLFTLLLGCTIKRMSESSSDDFVLLWCWKSASCVANVLIVVCEVKDKCYMVTVSP